MNNQNKQLITSGLLNFITPTNSVVLLIYKYIFL